MPAETPIESPQPLKMVRKSQRGIQEAILGLMHRNIGMHMTINEVQTSLETSGRFFNRRQVANGLYQLGRKGLIKSLGSGGPYVYRARDNEAEKSISPSTGTLYEVVGQFGNPDSPVPVVRNEVGQLFILESLEQFFQALQDGGKR